MAPPPTSTSLTTPPFSKSPTSHVRSPSYYLLFFVSCTFVLFTIMTLFTGTILISAACIESTRVRDFLNWIRKKVRCGPKEEEGGEGCVVPVEEVEDGAGERFEDWAEEEMVGEVGEGEKAEWWCVDGDKQEEEVVEEECEGSWRVYREEV